MFNGTIEAKSAGILGGGPLLAAPPETATRINPKPGVGASPSTATRTPISFTAGTVISRSVTSLFGITRDIDGNGKEGCGARRTVYGPGTTLGNSNDPSCITGT